MKSLYPLYRWGFYVPFFGVLTLLLGMVCITLCLFSPRLASRLIAPLWARLNVYATPSRIRIEGLENLDRKQSYIVIANHLSHYDIFALYGWLPLDLKWVMKKELRKAPVIGIAGEAMGHIFLDRSNREACIETLQKARDSMPPGTSILFFPEGTRSRNGRLQPFKKGAFRMAKDMALPILPISIRDTNRILPNQTLDLYPGTATLIIHPPIDAVTVASTPVDELVSLAHQQVASGLTNNNSDTARLHHLA